VSVRSRVLALIVLGCLAVAAVIVARGTSPREVSAVVLGPLPTSSLAVQDLPVLGTIPSTGTVGATWLTGSAPELRGRVVLYDFWTFGCSNCQHTLSHVKAWAARYTRDGLVVVGVHSPEFDYEAVPANVRDYVGRNGITYPVLLDPDMRVWTAFGVRAWPTFILADAEGRRRRLHVGEGGYDETEDAIRALLGVDPSSPRAEV
jgi:thiol-disulfide isomerase/thioredoxin